LLCFALIGQRNEIVIIPAQCSGDSTPGIHTLDGLPKAATTACSEPLRRSALANRARN
jgi:hypothetical protein